LRHHCSGGAVYGDDGQRGVDAAAAGIEECGPAHLGRCSDL
jgi:hypothetical protein